MTSSQRKFVIEEAKEFLVPDSFSGGCKQSSIPDVCVHFKPNGSIGKIEEGCPHWNICKGKNFKYN